MVMRIAYNQIFNAVLLICFFIILSIMNMISLNLIIMESNVQKYIYMSFFFILLIFISVTQKTKLLVNKDIIVFFCIYTIGLLLSISSIKSLNTLLLGENYAKSLGLNIKQSRLIIILATSLLAGTITAFSGPIAFIGLAIPHMVRQIFTTSNHKILLPAVFIFGAIVMLICDSIAQLPASDYTLPINAITSLIGAPVVIWLLVRKRKMVF